MPKFYLYNEVKLPKFPEEWDAESITHAVILAVDGTSYWLVCSADPFLAGDGKEVTIKIDSTNESYTYLPGNEKWLETKLSYSDSEEVIERAVLLGGPVWTNKNIRNSRDEEIVVYTGTAPVALPDAPTIVGFVWSKDGTEFGKTLNITQGDAVPAQPLVSAAVDEGALSVKWYVNGKVVMSEVTDDPALTSTLEKLDVPDVGTVTYQCVVINQLNGYTAETKTGVITLAAMAKPLSGCALLLLGWISGRLFLGQRKGSDLIASGTCGDNAVWNLKRNGLLKISGYGEMTNFLWFVGAPWNTYASIITNVVIGDDVTSIGNYAFDISNNTIRTVRVGPSVLSVGLNAFYGCSKLENVFLPEGITEIKDSAFGACTALQEIALPDSLTTLGVSAFYGCDSLKWISIPDNVTRLDYGVFGGCEQLEHVNIGAGVSFIGVNAFSDSTSLTTLTVSEYNQYFSAFDGVLFNKEKTTLAFYPWGLPGTYEVPDGVSEIGNQAFQYNTKLTTITIPESVTKIGYRTFYECTALVTVYYRGTAEQWAAITNGGENTGLDQATIIYGNGK